MKIIKIQNKMIFILYNGNLIITVSNRSENKIIVNVKINKNKKAI